MCFFCGVSSPRTELPGAEQHCGSEKASLALRAYNSDAWHCGIGVNPGLGLTDTLQLP
ncbi:hypothetical protein ACFL5S_02215 [Fibrobacterota bacterium]